MTDLKELIEQELDQYLEWPTADKSHVTTVSAKLFAEHVARLYADHIPAGKMAAPAVQGEPLLAVPDECPCMIVFDDADVSPIMFAGAGSRDAAIKKFEQVSQSWNAHLFVRIAANSRDDARPSACAALQPTEQQPDVAQLVDALEGIAKLPIDPCSTENDYRLSAAKAMATAALANYHKRD